MSTPIDYSQEPNPAAAGMTAEGIRSLGSIFEGMYADGLHPAAQMVVLRRGQVAFDRAIGEARGRPVSPTTPFLAFSSTKAFTAAAVFKLVEEGRIELDAPIAHYWPAFGKKGKQTATIRHTLLHQAGIPWRGAYRQIPLWPSWTLLTRSVANLRAEYVPGEKNAYHALNYGIILGEVVRRATGLPFEVYFERAFVQPLGLGNTWMKVPRRALRRSPRLYSADPEQDNHVRLFNIPIIRRALNPSGSMHSTAREMAIFYQMLINGGEYGGTRFLQLETIQAATAVAYKARDVFLEREVIRGHGFQISHNPPMAGEVGPLMGPGSSTRTFGHFGHRTNMAWADPDSGVVVVFLCNRLLPYEASRSRYTELSRAVWEAIAD